MPSVMIIGASRGIGLGFVQAYAAADGWQVRLTRLIGVQVGAADATERDVDNGLARSREWVRHLDEIELLFAGDEPYLHDDSDCEDRIILAC